VRPGDLPRLSRALRVSVGKQIRLGHERRRVHARERTERRQAAVFADLMTDPSFFIKFDDTTP
jgi:hypothetical protein